MDRTLILARWTLGHLRSEELPTIAAGWLADGLDSSSLRRLAGEGSPIMSDVAPLFERSLIELGLRSPNRDEALGQLARGYARQIVDGTMPPHEGAGRIWWEVANELDPRNQQFLSFVGAASELDEIPDRVIEDRLDRRAYIRELEDMIIAAARKLLEEEPNQAVEPTPGDRGGSP